MSGKSIEIKAAQCAAGIVYNRDIDEQDKIHHIRAAYDTAIGTEVEKEDTMLKAVGACAEVAFMLMCPQCNQRVSAMSKCTKTETYHINFAIDALSANTEDN